MPPQRPSSRAAVRSPRRRSRPAAPRPRNEPRSAAPSRPAAKSPPRPHLVAAFAYDQLCTFELGCVIEIFALPRPELAQLAQPAGLASPWYRFAVCAAERRPLRAAGGLTLTAPYTLALLDRADTIILPGWRTDEPPPAALLSRLRAAHRRGARLASICSGAFLLAAAGLLDGRPATTHWRYAAKLAARYPAIDVKVDALYVDDGRIITSAGSAAGLDMMLHLVRLDHGAKIANLVAQRLVIPPHRAGDQAQFVPRPIVDDEAGRLAKLMDWIRAHPALPHTLPSLARRAAMSPRTLQRHFLAATQLSPIEWLVRERVAVVKDLLESGRSSIGSSIGSSIRSSIGSSTTSSISKIAERAGFGSEESLRRHFRRVVGISPTQYKKHFAAAPSPRDALTARPARAPRSSAAAAPRARTRWP